MKKIFITLSALFLISLTGGITVLLVNGASLSDGLALISSVGSAEMSTDISRPAAKTVLVFYLISGLSFWLMFISSLVYGAVRVVKLAWTSDQKKTA